MIIINKLIPILFAGIITFSGCYTSFKSFCRHDAIYTALTVGEKYKVRIAYGPVITADGKYKYKNGKQVYHAQAQIFIDGEWKWLSLSNRPLVMIGSKDKGWKIEGHRSIEKALKWCEGDKKSKERR